jgi:hypothetical protein
MKRRRVSVLKVVARVLPVLLVVVLFIALLSGLVKYPEKYLSTWRYQLKCDIEQGNQAAISYYETNYVANGIDLFGEEE